MFNGRRPPFASGAQIGALGSPRTICKTLAWNRCQWKRITFDECSHRFLAQLDTTAFVRVWYDFELTSQLCHGRRGMGDEDADANAAEVF